MIYKTSNKMEMRISQSDSRFMRYSLIKIRISKPICGLVLLFLILFVPQCITVPVMYETAEVREEKRAGISGQYGEGSYKGLCESTKYNYKYGGVRIDYKFRKNYGNMMEIGHELGGSINGLYETSSSDTSYRHVAIMLQLDARFTGKVVTPTNPVRLGLKAAPGLLAYGGFSHINGRYDIGGEIYGLSYFSLLLGIGNPEFLTIGYNYYPFLYTTFEPYYSILTATYHYKKYSVTAGGLLPLGQDEVPKYHFILGIGIHY